MMVKNFQFDGKSPSFIKNKIRRDLLKDEAEYINLLPPIARYFNSFFTGSLIPSAWTNYPEKYKFIGVQINIDDEKTIYERVTYDFINLFGDVGGFLSFLIFIVGYVPKMAGR